MLNIYVLLLKKIDFQGFTERSGYLYLFSFSCNF